MKSRYIVIFVLIYFAVLTAGLCCAEVTCDNNVEMVVIASPPPSDDNQLMLVNSYGSLNLPVSAVILEKAPSSYWTYGCSATSAGMLFAYYDWHGYPDMYTGPANSGLAPLENLGQGDDPYNPIPGSSSIIATMKGFDGRADFGHVDDYWVLYGNEGQDPWIGIRQEHIWGECTADFMGTNQWKWQKGSREYNFDGSTMWFPSSGWARLYDYRPPVEYGEPITAGCHGLRLFAESRGYNLEVNPQNGKTYNYNQKVDRVVAGGFSFADYMAEIDTGRPVLLHITKHTMTGIGYDEPTQTLYFYDTSDNEIHEMNWTGPYYYNSEQRYLEFVTVLILDDSAGLEYTLLPKAGPGGAIYPSDVNDVPAGSTQVFTAQADTGTAVNKWYLDGQFVQQGGDDFVLSEIDVSFVIEVTFSDDIICDYDDDGDVDAVDLTEFAGGWQDMPEISDLNGDGNIDYGDFKVFAYYWQINING